MADTTDSNSVALGHEGSNPSPRTCSCGMPPEDYLHYGWHRIFDWNQGVFARAKERKDKEFDDLLAETKRKSGKYKKMQDVQGGENILWQE